jgi:hypothetical protein
MKKQYKNTGVVSVITGMCLLVAMTFIHYRRGWPLVEQSDLWLVRYSIPIVFFSGSIAFVVIGIVTWIGVFIPSYVPEITSAGRAKSASLAVLITLPMWITLSLVVYTLSDNTFWITVWTVFIVYLVFLLARGIAGMAKR